MSESEPILNQENVSNAIKDDIRLTAETLLHHLLNLTDENVSYAYTKEALIPLNTIKYRSYLHSLCYRFGCRLLNYGKSLEGEEKVRMRRVETGSIRDDGYVMRLSAFI